MSKIFAYLVMAFVACGLLSGAYDWFTGKTSPKPAPTPQPKIETPAEKPKPEVKRPEKSMMIQSYDAIAGLTGMMVTDSWLLDYGEYISAVGTIETHGFVELNGDDVKRRFWLTFDPTGQKVLRLKIDSDLIYSENGR